MSLTLDQRKKIYTGMLESLLSSKKPYVGFCSLFSRQSWKLTTEHSIYDLPELIHYRPTHFIAYWFPLDKEGREKRIEILLSCLFLIENIKRDG